MHEPRTEDDICPGCGRARSLCDALARTGDCCPHCTHRPRVLEG